MRRRVKNKPSLLSPAGSFLKRLAQSDSIFRRRVFRIGCWSFALFFVYSVMSGNYGIPRIIRLKMEKEALIQDNRRQIIQLVDNEQIRDKLRYDMNYIEYIARSRYHMAAPNEIIYRYRGH